MIRCDSFSELPGTPSGRADGDEEKSETKTVAMPIGGLVAHINWFATAENATEQNAENLRVAGVSTLRYAAAWHVATNVTKRIDASAYVTQKKYAANHTKWCRARPSALPARNTAHATSSSGLTKRHASGRKVGIPDDAKTI